MANFRGSKCYPLLASGGPDETRERMNQKPGAFNFRDCGAES